MTNESELFHRTEVLSKCLAGCFPPELLLEVGLDCFSVWSSELSKQLLQCLKGAVRMKVKLRALAEEANGRDSRPSSCPPRGSKMHFSAACERHSFCAFHFRHLIGLRLGLKAGRSGREG